MTRFQFVLAALPFFVVQAEAQAQSAQDSDAARCWNDWVDFRMKEVPKAEDTVSPANGKRTQYE